MYLLVEWRIQTNPNKATNDWETDTFFLVYIYIWNISCLYNLQVFCSFSLVLSFSLNFYSVRQQSPIILFGLCFQCCLSWLLSRFRWYKYETEKENGEKKCIMCTKQCVNNAPTFMTMQHWHRHYETGNSIQKFNIPHSYTAIDKVSQRAGYIEVNTLKRERETELIQPQIHCNFL